MVKATHLFLSEDEISNIKKYVPQALMDIPVLVVTDGRGMRCQSLLQKRKEKKLEQN